MRLYAPLLLLLSGCFGTDDLEDYYASNWSPPTVSAVSPESEVGTLGGGTATITGSGFGTDPAQLVVQFGDHSATIQSVSDSEIVVTVPPGPMTSGAVAVRVGTPTGYADGTYTYEAGADPDQVGYIQINNYYQSPLGGASNLYAEDYAFNGYSGITGVAETLSFAYPRLQTQTQGFFGGQATGTSDWTMIRPNQSTYAFAVENLHVSMGDKIVLTNTAQAGQSTYCPDFAPLASYRYPGGIEGAEAPYSFTTGSQIDGDDCDGGYARDQLNLCQRNDATGVPSYQYNADWPVKHDFFQANTGKDSEDTSPVDITVTAEGVGIHDVQLHLPEPVVFTATEGFSGGIGGGGVGGTPTPWSFGSPLTCYADEGQDETLDLTAIEFTWTPSAATDELTSGGSVVGSRVFVRALITELSYGWFGGIDFPIAAVLTVDDKNNYDEASGVSSFQIPASIMYQFPTASIGGSTSELAEASSTDGIMLVDLQRVTEYTLLTDDGRKVVFQYVTGDLGQFYWTNPLKDTCTNCTDDDGDGWDDADDLDCITGTDEAGFSGYACNDGEDNDGDGLADSEDPDCELAKDGDESNCNDLEDNDGDGLTDDDDPECADGGYEHDPSGCIDGVDNDADGWADDADPDCTTGTGEVGYGTEVCNDGVDNDGDGATDAVDAECSSATDSDESNCDDGVDNDADGTTDAADSDCAAGGYENTPAVTGCTDGLDGDGDGWTDAADPDCATGTEELGTGTNACNDGADNDGDTLVDSADPECSDASDEDESI